jgi:class 3 adenylate cyclase
VPEAIRQKPAMDACMSSLHKKHLSDPDETIRFPRVVEELFDVGGFTVGKLSHEPGWRYSTDMAPLVGREWCQTRHVGVVLSGRVLFKLIDGTELECGPFDIYECPPGHDSLVTSDEPLVTLEWTGARAWGGFRTGFHDRVLATLLLTDIVESTAKGMSVGEAAWRELLALHHERMRGQLEVFRGSEVDTTGDGILAMFDGAARALRCAAAMRDSAAADGLQIRVGVHVGEVEVTRDGIKGMAVHELARIASVARPQEILVAEATRALASSAGLEFEDRGEFHLKGLDGARRLFTYLDGASVTHDPHTARD